MDLHGLFNIKAFLSHKGAKKQNSFIYKLTETNMFAKFIEMQFLDGPDKEEILYFSTLMSRERTIENPVIMIPFIPNKIIKAYQPNIHNIDPSGIIGS